jgi:hypothetical protein
MNQEHIDAVKHVGDAVSALVVIGALASILPPIAATLTIIWTGIRIYETKTVQRLIGRED